MKRRVPLMVRMTKFLVGFKLTPVGRIAVLGIFTSAIGGVTVEIPIYQMFCGLICLFGIVEATGILFRPKLEVSSWLPDKVTAGEAVTGYIKIINQGRLPACDIMCALFGMPTELRHTDADRSVRTIPQGGQATLPFTIQTSRRGDFVLPEARIHSTFPFNLMRFGKSKIPERELRVLPTFHPLEQFSLPFSHRTQSGGLAVETRVGNSPDFIGNRDYIPGEPVRRLDFKAWARVGRPVVREFQDEFNADVALILDTFLPGKGKKKREQRQLEAAVSLTAAIAHYIDQHEAVIAAFQAGPDLYVFQPSAATTHFDSVLEVLAETQLTHHDTLPEMAPIVYESLETVSMSICIFSDWDEVREAYVRELVATGIAVRILIVTERAPTLALRDEDQVIECLDPRQILAGEVRVL